MAKNTNNPNATDPYGFSKLDVQALRKVIVDVVKQNRDLSDQKKDYVAATNEVINENKKKIEAALEALKTAEQSQVDAAHELAANTFLADESRKLTGTN